MALKGMPCFLSPCNSFAGLNATLAMCVCCKVTCLYRGASQGEELARKGEGKAVQAQGVDPELAGKVRIHSKSLRHKRAVLYTVHPCLADL